MTCPHNVEPQRQSFIFAGAVYQCECCGHAYESFNPKPSPSLCGACQKSPERKKILIIGGGLLQIPVIKTAKELNLFTVCIDRNRDCACAPLSDRFYNVDIFDREGALAVAQDAKVAGVAAIAIDAEDTAAYVAQELGLPAPPLRAARITRNKDQFVRLMAHNGLCVPRYYICEYGAPPYVPFSPPWIVRPVDNSASRGTSIVWKSKDLPEAISRARAHAVKSDVFLVQELLPPGQEFSTEIIFIDKRPYYLNSVLRPFWGRNVFGGSTEIGHISPAPVDPRIHTELYDLAAQVAGVLNVDWGVLKIDTLLPHNRPRPFLLEATLRLSGGCDSTHTFPVAHGWSSVDLFLKLAMGMPVEFPEHRDVKSFAAAVGFILPVGKITKGPPPDLVDRLGVVGIVMRVGAGDVVQFPEDCAGRAGFVIAGDDNPWEAWRKGCEAALAIPGYVKY